MKIAVLMTAHKDRPMRIRKNQSLQTALLKKPVRVSKSLLGLVFGSALADKKDLSLRMRIIIGGILILLVPLVTVSTVIFYNSTRTLEFVSKMQSVQIAKSLSSMIGVAIDKDMKILASVSLDSSVRGNVQRGDYEALSSALGSIHKKIGIDYEDISFYDTSGVIRADGVDFHRIGLSIADRDYFKEVSQGRRSVGSVVASKATGYPIFGISVPIYNEDGTLAGGVLGVVKADFLLRYIASIELGKSGYALVVDRKGMVIAHPQKNLVLKFDITNAPGGIAEISRRMIRLESGSAEYTFEGKRKVIGFAPVMLTGWSVAVTQNKDEVMGLAYSNQKLILIVSIVSLLLTVSALLILSGKISAPVQKTLATLNQAIEQATDGIVVIGTDRRVQFVNPAFARITDRATDDIKGEIFTLENTDASGRDDFWSTLSSGKVWSALIRGIKHNSSSYSINMTVTPVRDGAGGITSYLAISRDMTREVMMETQLRQSQKMEAIGTLAGGIAHDFNNILGAIFAYIELTRDLLPDNTEALTYLDETMKAAQRARDLISHILVFSRKVEQQKRPVQPKYIIKETLKLIRASLPATIAISDSLQSDASVMADPTQIHQVVMNLCTNAAYAMRERGGTLFLSLQTIEVDEEIARSHHSLAPGTYVELKVTDTGTGMPSQVIERVFDPFFSTKPQGEGTGLGLSVVHGIVNSFDGVIEVTSSEGKGSTFAVYLPESSKEPSAAVDTENSNIPYGNERILFVDDEESLVQVGTAVLGKFGYRVDGFTSSSAACEKFAASPDAYDAIITDYTMPQMTGEELAAKVRSIRENIPIILCTGYVDEQLDARISAAGINLLLKKPFSVRELAFHLRRLLD